MNKSKSINYKGYFDRNGYVVFRNFLPEDLCYHLIDIINDIEKNWKYHSTLDNGNNPYVTNIKREALQLYMASDNEYSGNLKKNFNIGNKTAEKSVKDMLQRNKYIYKKLAFLKYPIDNILCLLGINNWTVVGITHFIIYPGSKEQEIHHDSMFKMDRFFISIPLHDTPVDMGPTIFYSEEDLKHFRNIYVPKTDKIDKHGNIGFLHKLHYQNKIQFEKARRQYDLNLTDITVHRDITFHAGGHNKTNQTRRFIFIICDKIN